MNEKENMTDVLKGLQLELREFSRVRDWEQFHSPKNLSMALVVEAGELVEIFQWLTEEQSRSIDNKQSKAVEEELADIFLYLLRLADQLGVDLVDAAKSKIHKNENKYPVRFAKGNAKKYTEF